MIAWRGPLLWELGGPFLGLAFVDVSVRSFSLDPAVVGAFWRGQCGAGNSEGLGDAVFLERHRCCLYSSLRRLGWGEMPNVKSRGFDVFYYEGPILRSVCCSCGLVGWWDFDFRG